MMSAQRPTRSREPRRSCDGIRFAAVRLLDQAIGRLTAAADFEFFKHQTVGLFLRGRFIPPALAMQRLADIVRMGTVRVCGLEGMTPSAVNRLTMLLESMAGGGAAALPPEERKPGRGKGRTERGSGRAARPEAKIRMNSVEAEEKLAEAFDRLRVSADFSILSRRKVGEFWDAGAPHYHFVECLTFAQLVEIKPRNLLAKRSFSMRTALSVLEAVERCLMAGGAKG